MCFLEFIITITIMYVDGLCNFNMDTVHLGTSQILTGRTTQMGDPRLLASNGWQQLCDLICKEWNIVEGVSNSVQFNSSTASDIALLRKVKRGDV